MAVQAVTAAQRLDSRGKPTVQVVLRTEKGDFTAIVPSGASKGDYEAVELRDGDASCYCGNSVTTAVHNVRDVLGPALIASKLDPATDLRAIDDLMIKLDGTRDKSGLGANAILGISMAAARAGAAAKGIALHEFLALETGMASIPPVMPVPFFNVLNGGDHSGNPMAFQEFMIAPTGASSISEAVRLAAETYASLKSIIRQQYGNSAIGIGDEGGFAPPIQQPSEALDLLVTAIDQAGHTGKIHIGVDAAAQSFFQDRSHDLGYKTDTPNILPADDLSELYHSLLARYPIVLLEDPFGQDDWTAFAKFKKNCPVELVGDDLLATNLERIAIAETKDACNSLLLKVNQIGTISEACAAAKKAYEIGWSVFVSHRSGETTDDFIADLTVGMRTGHLKAGAPARGERVAKYNRLMDIEDDLTNRSIPHSYASENFSFPSRRSTTD